MDDIRSRTKARNSELTSRRLFWRCTMAVGAPVLLALALFGFEIAETQRIYRIIEANGGSVRLRPGSLTLWRRGDADKSGLIRARPLFSSQVAAVELRIRAESGRRSLVVLDRLPNLRKLDVNCKQISDGEIACIANCRQLAELSFDEGGVTAEQIRLLARCSMLHTLRLNGSATDSAVEALESLPVLQRLRIANADIGERGANGLSRLTRLRDLELSNVRLDPSQAPLLGRLSKLESLKLDVAGLSEATFQSLGQITTLWSLSVNAHRRGKGAQDYTMTDADLRSLAGLTNLTELSLTGQGITDDSIDTLLQFAHLESLSLNWTGLSDQGALRLADGLNVRYLNLSSFHFKDRIRLCSAISSPRMVPDGGQQGLAGIHSEP